MYIKKLELANFQVIEKFTAEFDGAIYFVTGDNELGKSTLLKAIGALLTGSRDAVLRNGAEKGFAKMIVGDDGEEYDVQLSFTEANPRGTLTIKQKTSGMQTNNVSMLQKLFGYQDFDAVEFSRWSESAEGRRKQIEVIKSLMPAEIRQQIEEIDAAVARIKEERTGVNRDCKTFAGFVTELEKKLTEGDEEKYAQPMDMAALMEKQKANVQLMEKAKTAKEMKALRESQIAEIPDLKAEAEKRLSETKADCAELLIEAEAAYHKAVAEINAKEKAAQDEYEQTLVELSDKQADLEKRLATCNDWLAKFEATNADLATIPTMIAEAEAHNQKHAIVSQLMEKRDLYESVKAQAAGMDAEIAEKGEQRAALVAQAKLPIDGLTFGDDGLVLNGVPFVPGKVSDSQIMEVATKLVIAANPKVKVFRIARGESLGEKRLKAIVEMAKANGFQGFIENVVRGQEDLQIEEYTEV